MPRRLLRIAFNTLTALSLVLAVGVLALWVRSTYDDFPRYHRGNTSVWTRNGELIVICAASNFSSRGPVRNWSFGVRGIGIALELNKADFAFSLLNVILPLPLMLAVLLFLPVAQWVRRWRTNVPTGGRCPTCGYDLRATPDRCPECGAVVEGANV